MEKTPLNDQSFSIVLAELLARHDMTRKEMTKKIDEMLKTTFEEAEKYREMIESQKPKIKHWPGYYSPPEGGMFWTIEDNEPMVYGYGREYKDDRTLGICCETKEEAGFILAHKKARLQVIDRLAELNDGWIADWKDWKQPKYYPRIDHLNGSIIFRSAFGQRILENCFYAKKDDYWISVREELGEETINLALWPDFEEWKNGKN